MLFKEFVQINPKVDLKKGKTYPYVGMADVNPSRGYVTNSETREYKNSRSKFKEGDTLFARITPCLENGKITRFKSDGIKKGFGSTEFFVFRAKEGVSDPNFVYYLSRSPLIRKTAEKSMAGASGRQRADITAVEEVEIDPPDLPTQQKIASILSAFDYLIENNSRRIEILEEMARRIYREWFVHFRFPSAQGRRRSKALATERSGKQAIPADGKPKIVDSGTELGEIPEGWEVKNVIDLYDTSAGGTPSRKKDEYFDGSIPWVKTKELNDSFIQDTGETITKLGLDNSSAKLFPKNSVLVAMYGATVGQLGILDMDATTNQACCAVMEKEEPFDYSYIFFSLLEYRNKLIGLKQGAAQQNINQGIIKEFKIFKPPLSILEEFQDKIYPLLDQIRVLKKKNDKLKETRDLLLPKLISGKVDVGELPQLGNELPQLGNEGSVDYSTMEKENS